jgi:hypothetical protein
MTVVLLASCKASFPTKEEVASLSNEDAAELLTGRTGKEIFLNWGKPDVSFSGLYGGIYDSSGKCIAIYFDDSDRVKDVIVFDKQTDAPDPNVSLTFLSENNAKLYVWEKNGFGGDFCITLHGNGTYQYYVGFLSSYIGTGKWETENGVLTMTEDKEFCGYDNVFRFRITDEGLSFIAYGSSKFMYVTVSDGDRFLFRGEVSANESSAPFARSASDAEK